MEKTVKQNILDSLTWFYEQLRQRDLKYLKMDIDTARADIVSGTISTPLLDSNGNWLLTSDGKGLLASRHFKD